MSSLDDFESEHKSMSCPTPNHEDYLNKVIHGDCLEVMERIKPKSVDMILTDLPYATTKLEWDKMLDIKMLYNCFWNICKENSAVVMTATEPFTSYLIQNNLKTYKDKLTWLKTRPSNVFNAKRMFMKWTEDVLIFYQKLPTFNPQMTEFKNRKSVQYVQDRSDSVYNMTGEKNGYIHNNNGVHYPKSVIEISNPNDKTVHPTQKPVKLFEYLIKTYSNESDTILDCCAGSGTTGVACKNTGRNYILIEKEKQYIDVMKERGL